MEEKRQNTLYLRLSYIYILYFIFKILAVFYVNDLTPIRRTYLRPVYLPSELCRFYSSEVISLWNGETMSLDRII